MSVTSPSHQTHRVAVYCTALAARRKGMSVVPIPPNGTKCPQFRWAIYQKRRPTLDELTRWFKYHDNGIALITGAISGGLEVLDFDTREIYQAWCERIHRAGLGQLHRRLINGYLESSPNGMHLLYRCTANERNQKLAKVPVDGPQCYKTLIETRGEGGLVVVAPSCGGVHPSGKPYTLLRGGLTTITNLSPDERESLFTVARTLDETLLPPLSPPSATYTVNTPPSQQGRRPGDCYNQQATWEEVLEPHGWMRLYTRDGQGYWQRPGKEGNGVSATTNYNGSDLLSVFSTSTVFEAGRSYSKFAAYTFLNHGGDFSAAAKALSLRGYGE